MTGHKHAQRLLHRAVVCVCVVRVCVGWATDTYDQLNVNGGQIWGDRGQKGAFRAVASQKKICLLEHQNAFAAIQSTFIGIIFVTILLEVSPGCSEESQ